jgi:protein O-GlcNAc transferase
MLALTVGGGCAKMAETQYLEGLGEESRGDLQEAEDCYEDALDYNPNHVETMRRLAQLKVRSNDFQEAIPLFERIVKLTDGSAESQNDLAYCYEIAGALTDAEAAYRKGIEAHPTDARLHTNFGLMLARQDRADEALAQLRAAMSEADAQHNLGRVLYEQGRRAEAHRAFERSRELTRKG